MILGSSQFFMELLIFLKTRHCSRVCLCMFKLFANMRKTLMFTVMHRRTRLILSADALSSAETFIGRHDGLFPCFHSTYKLNPSKRSVNFQRLPNKQQLEIPLSFSVTKDMYYVPFLSKSSS